MLVERQSVIDCDAQTSDADRWFDVHAAEVTVLAEPSACCRALVPMVMASVFSGFVARPLLSNQLVFSMKFTLLKRQSNQSGYQWSERVYTRLDDGSRYFVQRRRFGRHRTDQLVDLVDRRRWNVGEHGAAVMGIGL